MTSEPRDPRPTMSDAAPAGASVAVEAERDDVSRTLAGDATAFDALVDRYTGAVFGHVFRIVRNREDAEDVLQETFVRAYRYLRTFDASKSFKTWLLTIATNRAFTALEKRRRTGWTVSIDPTSDTPLMPEPAAADEPAAATIDRQDLAARVSQAVDRLPEKVAALVNLHYSEGLSIRDAAQVLGMGESAAKVALFRARKTLRQWLVEGETP